MSKDEFVVLYEKYKSGNCTPQEIEFLADFKDDFQLFDHEWSSGMGNRQEIHDEIYARLKEEITPRSKVFKFRSIIQWSAAAIILMICSISLYHYSKDKGDLANVPLVASKFETKSGEKKHIILKDGTNVWLNSGSSLTLADDFNVNTRGVNLVGEAYFDVSHREDKPFQVRTSDFNIDVLGTAFNVKAYPNEVLSEATLIRGSIRMKPLTGDAGVIILKPSQKITFVHQQLAPQIKDHQGISKTKMLIDTYKQIDDSVILETAWTNNRLEIYDQRFKDLESTLERWFDIKIIFKSKEVENYRITATFQNENITTVLNSLQKVQYFKYEMKENTIIISK